MARRLIAPPPALEERTVSMPLARPVQRRPGWSHRLAAFLRSVDRRTLPPVGRALTNVGRRALWRRVIASVVATTCVALLVLAVYTATRPATDPTPAMQGTQIGVYAGQSIPDYVSKTKRELASNGGDLTARYALVSFSGYLTPQQVATVLARTRAVQIFMRVGKSGSSGSIVWANVDRLPIDIVTAMRTEANYKNRDAHNLVQMLPLAGQVGANPSDIDAVRTEIARQQAMDVVEARAYNALCDCVFAVVVHASVPILRGLGKDSLVRAIDLVPMDTSLDHDTFVPPVPEQKSTATPPPMAALNAP
jgi:hypothetical protein